MSTRTFTKGTFQMLWDCEQCDSTGLLGVDHRHCPNCGAAQRAEARYFPSAAQRLATEHLGSTPDWECERCGSPNGGRYCVSCGAPRGTSGLVDLVPSRPSDPGISGQAPHAVLDVEQDEDEQQRADAEDDSPATRSQPAQVADVFDGEGDHDQAPEEPQVKAEDPALAQEGSGDDQAYEQWLAKNARSRAGDVNSATQGRKGSNEAKGEHPQRKARGQDARSDKSKPARPPSWKSRRQQLYAILRRPTWPQLGIVMGSVALLITLLVVILTRTRGVEMAVEARTWSRTTILQEWRAVAESNWCSSMPSQAYSVSSSPRIHHYNKIPDGEDCHTQPGSCSQSCSEVDNGNGSFSEVCSESCSSDREVCTTRYREEPVYADYCSYIIDRWVNLREATAEGTLPQQPYWPTLAIRTCPGVVSYGCEQDGFGPAIYSLEMLGSGATSRGLEATCERPETVWRSMVEGSRWSLRQRIVTGWIDCRTLEHVGS